MKGLKGTYQINSDKKNGMNENIENVLKRRISRSGLNDEEIKTNYREAYVFN